MELIYRQCLDKRGRAALFRQMEAEGLLPFAMSSRAQPDLADWLALTACRDGMVLLCCEDETGQILGCGLFTRQPYRVWHFDFTASGRAFPWPRNRRAAVSPGCSSIRTARPSWASVRRPTATHGGWPPPALRVLARLPKACWHARKRPLCGRRAGALHQRGLTLRFYNPKVLRTPAPAVNSTSKSRLCLRGGRLLPQPPEQFHFEIALKKI